MNFTNTHNITSHIVEWLKKDEYEHESKTISATGLLKPAKMLYLNKKHKEELQIDVVDLLKSRIGTAVHDAIEKASDIGKKEMRLYAEINGVTISGQFDIIIDNCIRDIKTTGTWKWGSDYSDYIKQLSIYRYLAWRNDIHLDPIGYIDFIFNDWSKIKAKTNALYPPCAVMSQHLNLWDYEDTENFIKERIEAIQTANEDTVCTQEELWQDPDKWAVKKKGNKRAIKLYNSEEDAKKNLKQGQVIEKRNGKVRRCLYCSSQPFCKQAKEMEKKGLIAE